MPGRIKKKKERERERVSRELHDSYDSERKPRKEDKRWKREGDYEERKSKDAQSTLERETTSAGERWNGEENSDLAEIIQPKYQQLFYI